MSVALVTGASRGLGRALALDLARRGWALILDARSADALASVVLEASRGSSVVGVAGDVTDEAHRREVIDAARRLGGLDVLVNNAGALGPSPPPALRQLALEALDTVYDVNVLAPLRLVQLALPLLEASRGRIINVTSEAAVESFPGWGGYGSSKAALESVSGVLAVEHPDLKVYWVDPGDMNTQMEQEGFPGEDVSDRPPPEVSVPGLVALITGDLPSGRYRAQHMR